MESGEDGLLITSPPKPSIEREKVIAEGQPFSEQFRKGVSGVADQIESLRAVELKKDMAAIGPRFDQIDHELSPRQFMSRRTEIRPFTTRCRTLTIRWLSSITNNPAESLSRKCKRTSLIQ